MFFQNSSILILRIYFMATIRSYIADRTKSSFVKLLVVPLAIFLLALVIRLVYFGQSSANPAFHWPIVDAAGYDQIARQFARDGTVAKEFFWQQFFYPFFLSIVYRLTGSSIVAAKLIQLLIGCITCVLTFQLGKRIFNLTIGIIAGVIMALYGPLIFAEAELVPAGWATFWAAVLLLILLNTRRKPSLLNFCLFGLCGGLSVITRPTFAPFLVVGWIWLALGMRGTKKAGLLLTRNTVISAFGFSLIVLPVAFLNQSVTRHFEFGPASGGINFYIGNNPDFIAAAIRPGTKWLKIINLPGQHGFTGDMWQRQQFFYEQTLDYIRSDPADFCKGLGDKTLQFFNSREMPGNVDVYLFGRWSPLLRSLTWKVGRFGFPFGLILPLALVGLVYHGRKIPACLWLLLLVYPPLVIIAHIESRYRLPMIVPLALLSAAGAWAIIRMIIQHRFKHLAMATVGMIAMILFCTEPGPFSQEKYNYEGELYFCIGTTAGERNQKAHAAASYQKALQIKPGYSDAHINLGVILAERGKLDQAIEHYNQALNTDPDLPTCHNNLANALMQKRKFAQAIEHYNKALRLNPAYAQAYIGLGEAFAAQGKLDKAIEYYSQALKYKPNFYKAHYQIAIARARQGRFDLAIEHFNTALQSEPGDPYALRGLASAYIKVGRFDEAVGLYQKLLKTQPRDADVHYNLGAIYIRQGKIEEAINEFRTLREIEPQNADTCYMLGNLLIRKGQTDQGIAELRETLRLNPDHIKARQRLNNLLNRRN